MKSILIVDDELPIRLLLEQTLEDFEDHGVEISLVENGAEALERIRADRPELVLLDVMMPVMNGFDVLEAVRADEGLVDVHVVLLTAKGQEADRARGMQLGADLYLTKPFDPSAVVAHASKVLGIDL